MRLRRSLRSAVLVCFVVAIVTSLGAVAFAEVPSGGVVTAQDNGSDNESDLPGGDPVMPGSDNESANESDDDDDGGGVMDRIGAGLSSANPVPSPEEAAEDVWEWIATQLQEMMTTLIDDVFNELLGTPTIENDGAMGIMGTPVDSQTAENIDENDEDGGFSTQNYSHLYDTVYLDYVMPLVGAVLTLMALTVLIGPALSAFTQRRMFATLGSAAFAVFLIVASWELAALLHAFSDGVTMFFLPDSDEVLSSERTVFSGPLAVTIGLLASGGATGIALLALHAMRHMLLYIAPIVLPALILIAYWGGHRRVKQVGSLFIWQYYALLVWNWPTALLLRVAYELDWTFHSSELINFGMTMAIFLIAVGIPLAVSASFTLIGISMRGVASSVAGEAFANTQNRSSHATAAEPSSDSRTRHAERRLKSGADKTGISAKNRAAGASARDRSRFSQGSDEQSSPAPSRGQPGATPPSRKSPTDGGVRRRNRSMSTDVAPAQRQRTSHKAAGSSKPKKPLKRTNGGYTVITDD